MKVVLMIFAVVSLSQGFPRPSAPKDDAASRRQGVHYGYPETPSDPYTSTQATAYTENPSYSTTWSKPEELTASYYNSAADQSSSAQKATTVSPYASQSQTADRQADSSQAQGTQTQPQADQSTQTSPYDAQSETTTNTQTQNTQTQTQADQSAASKPKTELPYAAQRQTADNLVASTETQSTQTQTQADSSSAQKPSTASPYGGSLSQTNPNGKTQNTQTQTDASVSQTQDSASTASQNPASQSSASQASSQTPTYQNSATSASDTSSTAQSTQSQTSSSSTQTSNQTPQNHDASNASNQAQSYPSQTTPTSQDSTSSQSNTYSQNNNSSDYVNPPQPYNAGQTNSQSSSSPQSTPESKPSDNPQGYSTPTNTQYKVENVTSKTVSESNQASADTPVFLSSAAAASVTDSSSPDDNKKSDAVNKETTIYGNHATTFLELPKIIHKPAIVTYQVQIAPKVKGVPMQQEIAIMPPEGTKGERKPLVLLKQVVFKPMDERIQVIIPKTESEAISSPKVEVKGGRFDQEALNSNGQDGVQGQNQDQVQGQYQGQTPDQSQGQSQGQIQTPGQSQDQSQGQSQTPDQSQDQSQGQSQTPDQSQNQYQSQSQDQSQSQYPDQYQDDACGDHSACKNYNPNMCNQVWMKRHCKKMCGRCTPPEEEPSVSTTSVNKTSAPKHCEYSGIIHQSGETWSPGPCVPKCHCDNGNIKCSKLECPDLNCDKPVKRRWKCCPECLPNADNETRCGVETTGGNGESLCCVFPFNYRGVDYFTCTTTDAEEPWCSITRNYDRDGLWGNCVVKSKTGKKHVKQADSDEKTALILAAQLSGARKWRNSTNNQVTDALKAVPNPLSEDDRQKLNANDDTMDYTSANNVDQNAPGASNGISGQADYYKNAGVDISHVSRLDGARKNVDYGGASSTGNYKGNTTSYTSSDAQQPQFSPPKASEQAVKNNTYNPAGYYAQPASDPYSNYSYQTKTRDDGYSSQNVGNTADAQGTDARVSNLVALGTVGYDELGYNTTQTSSGGYNSGVSNTEESNTGGPNARGTNSGASSTGGSNTGESNPYSSYYDNANNQSSVSPYSGSYGQQSTSRDTTDNTVPNGIENQTSYQMDTDASTAQYGSNQPAST